jgi:hypothetical protein
MATIRGALLCIGLLVLTVVAYLPLWDNDFVDFDDEILITANPQVLAGLTRSGVSWAWTNDLAPYWQPLTWLSFQLDAHFFSSRGPQGEVILCPAAFHGQNLFWHAAGVLLLFGLWYRLTGARWRSFLVAALFALHPMHVESVAWAVERKDVLSSFFGILTLWAYAHYAARPGPLRYLSVVAAFLLSLLAKPMLITLPFVLLLLDLWPLGRWRTASSGPQPALPRAAFGRLVLEKVPLFALAAVFAVLTLEARERHGSLVCLSVLPFSARLVNALTAYGWYLTTTFWPVRLAVLYPHPYENWSGLQALVGAGCLVSLTALALWQARRRPWLLVGWLWFAGTLVPVIGLAQGGTQAWADRFIYWPHIGLFVAVVWGLGEVVQRLRIPSQLSALAAALVLAALGVLTWVQVGCWRNSVTLWEQAVAVTRDNHRAHGHLSRYYRQQGRLDRADFHLLEALRIQFKHLRFDPARLDLREPARLHSGVEQRHVPQPRGAPAR